MMLKNDNNFVKEKENFKKKKTRKIALFLFLGTVAFSFIFWSFANLVNLFQKIFKPTTYFFSAEKNFSSERKETVEEKKNNSSPNKPDIQKEVSLLTEKLAGVYGIYFYNLTTKEEWGINENEIFTAASVNKLPIMVAFYQEVEKGRFKEDEIYILKKEDIQDYGTGQMRYQKPGTKYSYEKLVELSGKLSDNTAAYVLGNLIGLAKIQATLEKLKMGNTSLKDNTTTPKEMGKYLVELYNNKLINESHKTKIFDFLTNTEYEDRIPKGVPQGIKVVHKIGNEIQVYNDCGIVFDSSAYVLCVLTKEVHEDEALEVIPKISRLVWEYNNRTF